jgi:L-alanine-DL-glutamate epimerase-like enolase superfamily enzyme
MAARISGVAAYRTRLPLIRPYHLSLASLEAFDSVLLRVLSEAGEGVGETTETPGYYAESLAEAWRLTTAWGPRLLGRSLEEGLADLRAGGVKRSFAATSLFSALETAGGQAAAPERGQGGGRGAADVRAGDRDGGLAPGGQAAAPERGQGGGRGAADIRAGDRDGGLAPGGPPAAGGEVPLVGTIQGETPEALAASVRALQTSGYQTLKFKVGFDVAHDLDRLRVVQAELGPGVTVRLDANQGYTLAQARRFLEGLEPRGVELLEQPLAPDAWAEMARLARQTPVPLMLDEAIEEEADLRRTIDSGCAQLVKFKLMKCASPAHLEELIDLARRAGLGVILGNGVASDIGCLHEAAVAHRTGLTELAGEMNGFLKIAQGFLEPGLEARQGRMILPAAPARLRWDRVADFTQEVQAWGEVPGLPPGQGRG